MSACRPPTPPKAYRATIRTTERSVCRPAEVTDKTTVACWILKQSPHSFFLFLFFSYSLTHPLYFFFIHLCNFFERPAELTDVLLPVCVQVNDTCTGSGTCTGIDACIENQVECLAPGPCEVSVSCLHGQCIAVYEPVGQSCDDGDAATDFDSCQDDKKGKVVCRGVLVCEQMAVECPTPNNCQEPVTCANGKCPPLPAKPDGYLCDDFDSATDNDMCAGGVCVGELLCLTQNITCPLAGPCEHPVKCANGMCPNATLKDHGSACDDGDDETLGDKCQLDGTCVGVNPCDTMSCEPQSQCHTRACWGGNCQSSVLKANGTACDDQDDDTEDDMCNAEGECRGIAYCKDVICAPPTSCQEPVQCSRGVCPQPSYKEIGTECDDGNYNTIDGEHSCREAAESERVSWVIVRSG